MNHEVQSRLDEYVEMYHYANEQCGSDEAGLVVVEQIGKDLRLAEMRGKELRSNGPGNGKRVVHGDEPATEKQLALLKSLNVPYGDEITRQDASYLIDAKKNGKLS